MRIQLDAEREIGMVRFLGGGAARTDARYDGRITGHFDPTGRLISMVFRGFDRDTLRCAQHYAQQQGADFPLDDIARLSGRTY